VSTGECPFFLPPPLLFLTLSKTNTVAPDVPSLKPSTTPTDPIVDLALLCVTHRQTPPSYVYIQPKPSMREYLLGIAIPF
jgi:hypothetical protein